MTFDGPVPGVPGAIIRTVRELPDRLPGAVPAGVYIQAVPGRLLITMPGVARYLVCDGRTIDVAPEPGADAGAVAIYLEGSARGALIHQRGELPLHAATLMAPDASCVVALCGASALGKSTLAAALSRRGWMLVADDLTRLAWDGDRPIVWPSRDRIKLWRDACERFGFDTDTLPRVRDGMEKFSVPVPARTGPAVLTDLVELVTGTPERCERVGFGIGVLTRNTFRPRQVRPLGKLAEHMGVVARTAGAVRIAQLGGARMQRPEALADALEARLR
jgi:hypothetical protein